ncbi:ABC transporter ATP-binding protein [Candidatus Acetothermia bacterium]|jgi:iron complex transport system ATP-binding protein|nr:ABC transporter ATP-binding protein [Candidatus Acetothermia bacterium]MCI2426944.1 ABC transporter ATP-binding protein [Candidatus Acetothermia bacterium]MCI2428913.1 ABC transporter ATP-binding protein [Candidatus Acetothermia bacterium]
MIELKDVSIGYNRRPILTGINFQVASEEIVGLIGPNASGKTTLLKGINRLVRLFTGRILVNGIDIAIIDRGALARLLATVPQNPTLPAAFTAFELVLMGRTPHLGLLRYEGSKDIAIAWQAMEATQTAYLAERRIGELSGGERQQLVIARALTQQPKAILLDEPTANLDINHQIETLNLIKRLCREQRLAAIIAQHDLNLAAQYCDQVVLLHRGEIYAKGTPQDVITTQNIKAVYGAEVAIHPHPVNQLPVLYITAGEDKEVLAKGKR